MATGTFCFVARQSLPVVRQSLPVVRQSLPVVRQLLPVVYYQGKWYVEDPTGCVQLDLTRAISFLYTHTHTYIQSNP